MKVSIIEDESILRQLSIRGDVRDKVQSNRQDWSAFGSNSATTVDVVSYSHDDIWNVTVLVEQSVMEEGL